VSTLTLFIAERIVYINMPMLVVIFRCSSYIKLIVEFMHTREHRTHKTCWNKITNHFTKLILENQTSGRSANH